MDARNEFILNSRPGETGAEADKNDDQEVGVDDTARPDIVWLNNKLAITNSPPQTSAKLYGIYRPVDNMSTISLIIEHKGTEYRTVRYHKPVMTIFDIDEERLKIIHKNMVNNFMLKYSGIAWPKLLSKFLSWNTNRLYAEALQSA
jgi:hypothetical protein